MNKTIIVRADKWVNNGFCIGYLESETYFISGAIPGELVECLPIRFTKKFKHIKVTRVVESSPERVQPDCELFLVCGGCSFRHISYSSELEIKKNLFLNEYNHKFPDSPIESESIRLITGNPLHYRNNVQFKIQNNKKGFFQFGSNDLVEFTKTGCYNLPLELNEYIFNYKPSQDKEGKLRFTDIVSDYGKVDSEFMIGNKKIKVPKDGFFQINRYLIEIWIKEIIQFLPEANLNILELFSGSGLISLFLSTHCASLVGYELESNAVTYARENAKLNQAFNLEFHVRNLYIDNISQKHLNQPFWVMNPPRNGLGNLILEQIINHKPEFILYSSCNYISLIQDLKKIKQFYHLKRGTIADFFPRTPYFETLILLEKI